MDKGLAYESTDGVYFDTAGLPRATASSPARTSEDLESGARIEVDENKKHPMDFALWKARKAGRALLGVPLGQRAAPAGTSSARP